MEACTDSPASGFCRFLMSPDSGKAEIIAKTVYPGLPRVADNLFQIFHLFFLFGSIKQNVIPVGRTEVLNPIDSKSLLVRLFLKHTKVFLRPNRIHSLCLSIIFRFISCHHYIFITVIIIGQMNNQIRTATLSGKCELTFCKHVMIKSQSQFHLISPFL